MNQRFARELLQIAREVSSALLEDYGIADALSDKVWNELGLKRVSAAFEKQDWQEAIRIGEMDLTIEGRLVDLARNLPEDKLERYGELTYKAMIIREGELVWARNGYTPSLKRVLLRYNAGLPANLIGNYGKISPKDLAHLYLDIRRYDISIQHEVTHALRDAETKHITKFIDRAQKSKTLSEFYNREHDNIEFERDAIVNGLARLYRRMKDQWDEISLDLLRQMLPGLQLYANMPVSERKKWIDRLLREGLLGKRMLQEFRSGHEE